jgi:outer membrane protein assembly factor BamB
MKNWLKWTLGIGGVFGILLTIAVVRYLSKYMVLSGTQDLDGLKEAVPEIVSEELKPLLKGDADWISWLGVDKDSRSKVTGIRTDWTGGLSELWEVDYLCQDDMSAAWSAPVIQGNRLVVCGRDSLNDLVFCLNPADGTLLWQEAYEARTISNHGSGPRATPFIDNDRVYTFGRSGILACWSLVNGSRYWLRNVNDEGGESPRWGHSSSPLILDDYIIVQGGGTARTIAFDKRTGETAWKSGQDLAGYAAIQMMEISGKPMLINFHGKGLAVLSADTGNELWNIPWETDYDVNATTPVVTDGCVFITSGYRTGSMLIKVHSHEGEILWRNKAFSSLHSDPYVIDGHLYGYSGDSYQNRGSFKCVNLSTGAVKWTTNQMGWGTCMYVDGYLLCCDIKGNVFLMKPNPENFMKVASLPNALGSIRGPVWTRPVIANGRLYLRCKQRLICYDLLG